MRLLFALLLLLALAGPARPTTDVSTGDGDDPRGAVILVVDGMGRLTSTRSYRLGRSTALLWPKACLFNLTGRGARVL